MGFAGNFLSNFLEKFSEIKKAFHEFLAKILRWKFGLMWAYADDVFFRRLL